MAKPKRMDIAFSDGNIIAGIWALEYLPMSEGYIATIRQTAGKKILVYKIKLDKLKVQKKALMQVLLTGKRD